MASQRRFGLPHPLDAEITEDPSSGRKPGLWESFKRALGGTPPSDAPAPPPLAHLPEPPPPTLARPPVEPPAALARSEPDPAVEPVVPFLDEPPAELPPGPDPAPVPQATTPVSSPTATTAVPGPPETRASSEPAESRSTAPRLARGLASFSRHNPEREKKFGHLIRENPAGDGKHPKRPKKSS